MRHVRQLQPEAVLCPDPTAVFFGDGYFNHRDHRVTGWATLGTMAQASGNPHYFADQLVDGLTVHRPPTCRAPSEPNCWIDISDALERKIEALFCHTSQLVETGPWLHTLAREQAEEAGRAAGVDFAEYLRKLTFE